MNDSAAIFYNDIEEYPVNILDQHIEGGDLPEGDIYFGDIRDIDDDTLTHYTSWHLFAGIGGMPYGLRLGGWRDEWPILTAGFPCQPVSNAGKKLAQSDPRWLWPAVVRVLRVVRPPVVLLENTPGLLVRGMEDVLRDLAESGYYAQWRVLAAADVGSPQERERVWIVAYSHSQRHQDERLLREWCSETKRSGGKMADAESVGRGSQWADATDQRDVRGNGSLREDAETGGAGDHHRDRAQANDSWQWWATEPAVGRVANGVPHRVDRLKALGNAVVPQVVSALVPWILEGEPLAKKVGAV